MQPHRFTPRKWGPRFLAWPLWRVGLACLAAQAGAGVSAQLLLLDARGGFDSTHNVATGSGFAQFRSAITAAGFSYAPVSSFESANLQGAVGVVLLQPYSAGASYSASELAALAAFGSHSGLLLLADGGSGSSGSYLNALSAGFGVTFSDSATEPLGADITQFQANALTDGVGSIRVDYQRRLTIGAPAADLTPGGGANDFAAVAGRAVFVSDSSIFMDADPFSDASIDSGDNRKFVHNVILTVVPEPSACVPAVLLLGGAMVLRWRQRGPARDPR